MPFQIARKREFRLFSLVAFFLLALLLSVLCFSDFEKITVNENVLRKGDEGFDEEIREFKNYLWFYIFILSIAVIVFAWIGFSKREFKFLQAKKHPLFSKYKRGVKGRSVKKNKGSTP